MFHSCIGGECSRIVKSMIRRWFEGVACRRGMARWRWVRIVAVLCSGMVLQPAGAQVFTKITTGPFASKRFISGCAWGDFNNDGRVDLLLSGSEGQLLQNNGNGSWSAVMDNQNTGVSWGDINNDGFLDILETSPWEGLVIRTNRGNNTFGWFDLHSQADYRAGAPVWVDYDGDGRIEFSARTSYRNPEGIYPFRHFGTFIGWQWVQALSTNNGFTAVWSDLNSDGRPDVFVSNSGTESGYLYLHTGTNLVRATIPDVANSAGAAAGDYDNDGDLDLLVANASGASFFYRNDGGTLRQVSGGAIGGEVGQFTACAWDDYDNDGDLDAFVTSSDSANLLFRNNGDGTFEKVQNSAVTEAGDSTACAWADYDNDGDLDLFVANYTTNVAVAGSYLFRNDTPGGNWLKVRVSGRSANRAGLGVKVRVRAEGRWQVREISGGNGLNQDEPIAHF